ncbi:4Fe-4S ferredoxin [Chitinispirillum alkaliphilum]|nr:4Fe-4S ferredoxin [Chitinispirillum alkaliphilum]
MKRARKIALTGIFLIIALFGWKYPLLGLGVGVVMLLGVSISPFKGRWVCGNVCPRGAFLDTGMSRVTLRNKLPRLFRSKLFKWSVVAVLMGLMIFRSINTVESLPSLGRVLWGMCFATSIVAIYLGVKYNHRAWCSICPMGTIQENLYKLGPHN